MNSVDKKIPALKPLFEQGRNNGLSTGAPIERMEGTADEPARSGSVIARMPNRQPTPAAFNSLPAT